MQPSKTCLRCGRIIEWRAHWARNWEQIRHCSDACRNQRLRAIDTRLEETILQLLAARPHGSSICPSEAARFVKPHDWQPLMQPSRRAARRLVARHQVEITQAAKTVDPSTAKGPIRIRRGPEFPEETQ